MKKSAKSVTENSVWITELTDAEMESTTGGLLTNDQLDGWLTAYKNGTLQVLSVAAKLQREFKSADGITDVGIVGLWLFNLAPEDKKTVAGAVASSLVSFVKTYLHLA